MSEQHPLVNYNFIKTIGEGTFGKVKLALHKPTKEQVAIKILEKAKIKNKKDLERIEKEIKYMKKLNHPNIVKIYEIIENENNFYISMEYVSGGELFNYIVKNKRLEENEASFFYSQIIHIIQEIHKYKICHRDLKPENLLLTPNKTIKLIDFGLSNEYENYLYTPCGSPCYASPEVIKGLKYSGLAIDLWASGIILFSMLCGYLPFDDKNNEKLFRKILKCRIEFPRKFVISENAQDLIKKILRPDPSKRITLEEILEHPFLTYGNKKYKERINMDINKQDKLIIDYMVNVMKISNDKNIIKKNITDNRHNHYTTIFNLLKKKYNEGRFNYSNLLQKNDTENFNRTKILKRFNNSKLNKTINTESNYNSSNNNTDSSLAQDIKNIIKKKVTENNNNIIIINNNNNLVNQPHKMNYLFNSLFTENKNTDNDKYKKILKKIDTSVSVEKPLKNNETINASKSPRINDYKSNGYKYNTRIKEKKVFYKKYINTSMNQQQLNTENDSIFKADSFNKNLKEQSQEKKMNLNLKGYNEYKKRFVLPLHLKTLTNLQYYTLNNAKDKEKENQNYTKISLKNSSLINSLIYGKNGLKKNLDSSSTVKNDQQQNYNTNNYRRSPENKIYTKYNNYFNNINDVPPGDKIKYEKMNDINKYTNNSLINEIKTDLNTNDNSSLRNSVNNKDKVNYYFLNTINTEPVNKNTLDLSNNLNKKRLLQIGKEHFYKKLNINKLREERKKIRVNKLIGLQDKVNYTNANIESINNNLSERERYPKSIYLNKSINNENKINYDNKKLKLKLKELTEKKSFNNSMAYSKKICTQNKSFSKSNNYFEISKNLNIYQISNRINKFCTDNNLIPRQTNNKYTIIIKQVNSFTIDINSTNDNCVLKFTHENGDEAKTKKYMIELYSEIAK